MRDRGRFAYIAYPLDQVGDAGQAQRVAVEKIQDELGRLGWGTFDPGHAFTIGQRMRPTSYIADVDRAALDGADALIALLPNGVATIGVPIEIERAARAGKPVAIVTGDISWMLAGYGPNVKILGAGNTVDQLLLWMVGYAESNPDPTTKLLPFTQLRQVETIITADDRAITEIEAQLPSRGYEGDAGYDLTVTEGGIVRPGATVDVPCNLAVELPDGMWGFIVGRSSTIRDRKLQVQFGIVDGGYRGELFICVSNVGPAVAGWQAGDRLAQLILMPNMAQTVVPRMVERLAPSDRGDRGFGSTGR